MPHYRAPIQDALFVLDALLELNNAFKGIPALEDCNTEICEAVFNEAAKLAENEFAPINASGDATGCIFDQEHQTVKTPEGFREAYASFIEGGWASLSAPIEFGGQGLPSLLGVVLDEFFASSNISLSMYSGLTHGAIVALEQYASDKLKFEYLESLISGKFSGTMCLTEPHCGTDLGLMKTKAILKPGTEDTYLLNGSKIWITGGEHDLTENIIHLVLAKLPDAPEGSKGISLFLVPKFLTDQKRNGIACTGLEHKMGIQGSATCFMSLDDAEGWLIGEPHGGLKCMFAMMNSARLMVGMQGLGLAEAAYQTSLGFAKERRQGRSLKGPQDPNESADCILVHPDVRRMLITQKVMIEGCRALAYWVGLEADLSQHSESEEKRKQSDEFVALMTPVVKAFLTDQGYLCCDLAVQSMGGSGYTKDWGAEQFLRDARIARIYEGTNGVQALDLVARKLPRNGGSAVRALIHEMTQQAASIEDKHLKTQFGEALSIFNQALNWLMMEGMKDPNKAAAAATPFLKLFGLVTVAHLWIKMADAAQQGLESGTGQTDFLNAKVKSAQFYFSQCLPEIHTLINVITAGDKDLMSILDTEL